MMAVTPSLLSWPELRQKLIREYGVLADVERELGRPQRERDIRDQIARLEQTSDLTLAEMLEEGSP